VPWTDQGRKVLAGGGLRARAAVRPADRAKSTGHKVESWLAREAWPLRIFLFFLGGIERVVSFPSLLFLGIPILCSVRRLSMAVTLDPHAIRQVIASAEGTCS